MKNQVETKRSNARVKLPRTVWALGLVSMFMDVSSEMIHSLLPVFMVGTLGVSVILVGFLDGLAEAVAQIVKVFSGAISDYFGKRKWLAAIGYGFSALTKPLFAIATGFGAVFFARIADRIGKGVRGAPRDALIADVTPPELRGAAYGLRQGLDTAGAFAGPLIAFALMSLSNDNFKFVFWIAVIPAFLALATMFVGVQEPKRETKTEVRKNPITKANMKRLGGVFWWLVAIGGLLSFARVGDAFLVLRASEAQVPLAFIPLVLVAMNVIYSLSSYPFGKLADRVSASRMLAWGIALLILASLVLSLTDGQAISLIGMGLGFAIWGLHLAVTQGLLSALIAKFAPVELRGTAFGVFNLISGLALLFSGLTTGWVWSAFGYSAAFLMSAALAGVTLALLLAKRTLWSAPTSKDA